jgi:hypothetical protein
MTDGKVALDAALRGMFRGLEQRGVPEHILAVVDQLETGCVSATLDAAAAKPTPAPPSPPTP